MRQTILGVLIGLVLAGVGMFWWQGRAAIESNAPPPAEPEFVAASDELPMVDPGDLRGPAPPELTERTREQMRFDRYDRNRDGVISRDELLASRVPAFRKLDVDGNNLLTFEEYAVTTVKKFEGADKNGDGKLTREEFATTAPKPAAKKPACKC
ncbi:MAG: EF-hand domain-containing protein [Erythrobacter sp.]